MIRDRLDRMLGRKIEPSPRDAFQSDEYQRINSRRQEHLASLRLDLEKRTVFEVGAGIGDHTSFFLDRDCDVTVSEPREDCLALIRSRFPGVPLHQVDVNAPPRNFTGRFEVVYAYGLLYHLSDPVNALAWLGERSSDMLLLETCVSFGAEAAINPVAEDPGDPTQAINGRGCRPTRTWVAESLRRHFEHVYFPLTQPYHDQFPIDWNGEAPPGLTRAVFVASRKAVQNSLLSLELPMRQTRS